MVMVKKNGHTRALQHGSLCTGIMGLDVAAHTVYGGEMAWYSEIEQSVLPIIEREWPDVSNLGDIKAVDWASVPRVDVLTAGYPCQPFSHAGKRLGDQDERHLWPYVAQAIRALRPRKVVLENVRGHLSKGFGEVVQDLAEAGFDAEWCVLRASDVGACHQRARLFVVATDTSDLGHERGGSSWGWRNGFADDSVAATDPSGERHGRGQDRGEVGRVDSDDAGEARQRERSRPVVGDRSGTAIEWGRYAAAIDRWERVLGRAAPAPTDPAGRLSPPFVEWMMGYPQGWTESLSRTQALKALGNAVVPQQGEVAIRLLETGSRQLVRPVAKS